MPPALAKLTRPRLYEAVARARLFQLLDKCRERPVVWISGPPGAGKTTLVASYVTERETPAIWYQIDPGDGDPATFFYYMGLAAQQAVRGKHTPLPLLTEESLPDLAGFGRRYARELFARLPEGATIVLDNVQEAPAESALVKLLEVWAEEIPEGINLLCISRGEPPASLMRQFSTGRLASIGWDAMRLTLEETRQIAAVKHKVSDPVLARLHEQSEGWAAGLTLMLERIQRTGDLPGAFAAQSREDIFSYFAGTLFDRQPADVRHVLLCTALLPRITASLAAKLTGNPNAGKLLDNMHRRHLFTNRRNVEKARSPTQIKRVNAAASEPIYEYHALFRDFLLEKLAEDYTPTALRRLAQDIAGLLEQSGEIEDAFELNRIAEDWDALARLLIEHAPNLLRQGRGQTLREWIAMLPASLAETQPYTQYWLGVSLISVDQSQAQVVLERAFNEFERAGGRVGQLLCAARSIETIFRAHVGHRAQDRWIAVIDRLLIDGFTFPDRDAELTVYTSLGLAAYYCQPRHPSLRSSMERVSALLQGGLTPEQMVTAGDVLSRYYAMSYQPEEFVRIAGLVSPAADDSSVPPLNRLWWWGRIADGLRCAGRYAEAENAVCKAERLAEILPGHAAVFTVRFFRFVLEVAQRHLTGVAGHLAELRRSANPVRQLAAMADAIAATHTKSLDEALHLCRLQAAACAASGIFFVEVLGNIFLAALLAQSRKTDELAALLAATRSQVSDTYMAHTEIQLSLVEAYAAIELGQTQAARELLSVAMATQADTHFLTLTPIPRVLPAAFSFGLEQDIGTARIKTWIKRLSILPENATTEHWPWPVRIRCMGKFAIVVDDEPLQFKGRAPAKPLELLKLLIAAGRGGLPARAIADRLWPDVEGDAALVNVDTNVHRLRKLFKQDPLLVAEGRVAIDSQRCWVDAWALERLDLITSGAAPESLVQNASEALRLYAGHFLDADAEQAWAVAYREKLRSGLIRLVSAAGKCMEDTGKFTDAIELYDRAIKLDNIAEPVYRQWMACLRERGEKAEALKIYRRCREMLSIVLGIQPSAETQAIAATLKV
ncbi:MAG: BTAD domain-containing putative transcriptional regulator [Burkholderiales bacterium]